jgi:hypothetical protein
MLAAAVNSIKQCCAAYIIASSQCIPTDALTLCLCRRWWGRLVTRRRVSC